MKKQKFIQNYHLNLEEMRIVEFITAVLKNSSIKFQAMNIYYIATDQLFCITGVKLFQLWLSKPVCNTAYVHLYAVRKPSSERGLNLQACSK